MVLARLAVDSACQKQGLGSALLRDALRRTIAAAQIAGVRAVLLHAMSDDAKRFHARAGFHECPVDPMMVMITLAEVEKNLSPPSASCTAVAVTGLVIEAIRKIVSRRMSGPSNVILPGTNVSTSGPLATGPTMPGAKPGSTWRSSRAGSFLRLVAANPEILPGAPCDEKRRKCGALGRQSATVDFLVGHLAGVSSTSL
jgi:hypothetical protein